MSNKANGTSPSTYLLYYITPFVLLLFIICGHFWLKNKEQRIIKKNLHHLIETLSFDHPPSLLVSAANSQTIINALTLNAKIDPGAPLESVSGRRELAQLFHLIHQHIKSLRLDIEGLDIRLDSNKKIAAVNLTLKARVNYGSSEEEEYREYRIGYVKAEGQWLIDTASPRQTIRQPQL